MIYLQQILPALPDSVPDTTHEIEMLKQLPLDELLDTLTRSMVTFVINVTIAIVVFYVGKFVITKLYHMAAGIMLRRRVDASLSTFVLSLIRIVLYFILVVTVIGILGINTSSFIALFASAGVAIGMALSGTLQNFAGGVLILLLKPYKINDYIEAQGYAGVVREIQIFHTIITTYDNKSIIIPNGGLSTGSINNWSREDYRRVDWAVSISYGDSIDAARAKILEIINSDPRVVERYIEDDREKYVAPVGEPDDGEPQFEPERRRSWLWRMLHHHKTKVRERMDDWEREQELKVKQMLPRIDRSAVVVVDELADSCIRLKAKAWTRTVSYWDVFYDVYERIYNELPSAGITFPFPQLDVHLHAKATENHNP